MGGSGYRGGSKGGNDPHSGGGRVCERDMARVRLGYLVDLKIDGKIIIK
jgi:hypothetical protein